jgi:hypothetical protein
MAAFTLSSIRLFTPALGVVLALGRPALAGDVSVKLDANAGFVIENSNGAIERLRVDEATGNVSRNGALFVHTTGANNLFIGAGAGNPATTGAGGNTAVGYGALSSNSTGSSNSAFGDRALNLNTTGNRNIAVGRYAGQNQTTGSDNIYLANDGVAAESGRIRIGTPSTHTATFVAGIHGANLGGSALPVFVNPSGQLGTGGGTQPPWIGDVDASDFDLTGLRRLAFGPVLENDGGFNIDMPNSTGHGFTIASAEYSLADTFGIARDTTATIGFNWNEGGVNHGTPFNPSWGLAFESNFPTGAWPEDTVQEFHMVSQVGRTSGTVASGVGFTADQVVVVEEPGNGATVGVGILKSIGAGPGATAVIDWIYSENSDSNPPSSGDTVEGESSTTVVSRSGVFEMNRGGLWVYPSPICGEDGSTATAILGLSSIANQVGTTADLVFVRSSGPGTDVVLGNCVRQANSGATALLGPISIPATTTFTSPPTSTNHGAWRPMTTIFKPSHEQMVSSWFGNRTLFEAGVPTLRIGSLDQTQTTHWLGIASRVSNPGGNDYVGAIGDDVDDQNFAIWGRWWIFEPGGFDKVSLGASAITGTRMQDLPDVNGMIAAFTDLAGCDADAPLVASGEPGGIKCGAPSLASSARVLDLRTVTFASRSRPTLASDGELPPGYGVLAHPAAGSLPALVGYDEQGQPVSVKDLELVTALRNEMKQQQRTIEEQARAIDALREEHEREVGALTKRLARLETRRISAPGEAER